MDEEKRALYKRRSSILKTGKTKSVDEDEHTGEIIAQRRVSFASKFAVKPFTHDAEANTIWDATYEEVAVHSDQSTCHTTTDSASHMSIEVSTICLAPQNSKYACVNKEDNILTKTKVPPKLKQHKPKFGIYVEEPAKFVPVNCQPDDNILLKPSLLKENINVNIPLESAVTVDRDEDDMQIESNTMDFTKTLIRLPKDGLKQQVDTFDDCPMDIINNVFEENFNKLDVSKHCAATAMNFTIHESKKKNKSNNQICLTNGEDIEENDGMEFTTAIPMSILQEALKIRVTPEADSGEDNPMDITTNLMKKIETIGKYEDVQPQTSVSTNLANESIDNGVMEFTSVIPIKNKHFETIQTNGSKMNVEISNNKDTSTPNQANVLINVQLKQDADNDDGDMEFTKSISPQLLEKIRLNNDLNNCVTENAMDITRKHSSNEENDYCNENWATEYEMDIENNSNKNIRAERPQRIQENIEELAIEAAERSNVKEKEDIVPVEMGLENHSSKNIRAETSQRVQENIDKLAIEAADRSNVIEEEDIVPVLSNGRESSFFQIDGSFHTNPASEVDDTQYLINYKSRVSEGTPLRSTLAKEKFQIYQDSTLDCVDICQPATETKFTVVDIPKVIDPIPVICNAVILQNNILIESTNPSTEDNEKKVKEIPVIQLASDISENILLNKSTISEINVFKPSSKNNTRCSFFEPMEVGTPYITRIDESNDQLNTSGLEAVCTTESNALLNAEVTPIESALDVVTSNPCDRLLENKLDVKCYETDKIIFITESTTSFETEQVPVEAYAIPRRSLYGVAEGQVISTHQSTQELLNRSTNSAQEVCLKYICEESKPIADDSLAGTHLDDEDDDELIQNLSKSRVVLYDSNDASEDDSVQRKSLNEVNKPVSFSSLSSDLPSDCSVEQLYELLGWPAEDEQKSVDLISRFTEEYIQKQVQERQVKRLVEEKSFEKFVQNCHKMLETVSKMNEEDAVQVEEDLARNQGRDVRLQSLDEWIKQQKKIPSTLWRIHTFTDSKIIVCSRNVQFHLEFESKTYIITNLHAEIDSISKLSSKLRQYINKLIMDRTQKSLIYSAIGTKFNLRTFLEYLQMKLEDVVEVEREFLKLHGKLLVEANLSFDDNFTLQYSLIGRSKWLLQINCLDINNLSEPAVIKMSTVDGTIKLPEREIKNLAKKCPRGLHFLNSFIDAVYKLRNNRERQHCEVLNELLTNLELRQGNT